MGLGLLVGPPWKDPIIVGTVVVIVLLGTNDMGVGVLMRQAEHRERDAGYTTLFTRGHLDLWKLDAKTGEVRRRHGEPR